MRDFTRREIDAVLDVADDVQKAIHNPSFELDFRRKYHIDLNEFGTELRLLLENIKLANLFLEKSTRTNFSFRSAVITGHGYAEGFSSPDDTSLKKGETWADTVAQFAGWGYNGIVMRSTTEGLPRWTKESLTKFHHLVEEQHKEFKLPFNYHVPIILNGGDGTNQHPTQCFLDLLTMRQIARAKGKDLDGLDIALMNDLKYGRTIASLMSVAHHFNFKLHFAHPNRFGPQAHRLEHLAFHGVEYVDHGENFQEAMAASLIAYHSRPQKERIGKGEDLISIKKLGRITRAMYEMLGDKGPYLMHPLPVDSETFEEIYHDMDLHPKNVTKFQSMNGLYIRIALLALGLDRIVVDEYKQSTQEQYERTHLRNLPLREREDSEKKLRNPRTGFIEGNGVVLDHIPAGMERRLEGILGFEHSHLPIVGAAYMPVEKGREAQKDMIKIHAPYEFSPAQWEAMALIAPDITVSYVQGGKVVRKVRPVLGDYIEERVKCGNDACVTNMPYEHAPSAHHIEQRGKEKILTCHFCERTDTIAKIYEEQRFNYIGQE